MLKSANQINLTFGNYFVLKIFLMKSNVHTVSVCVHTHIYTCLSSYPKKPLFIIELIYSTNIKPHKSPT